MNSALTFKDGIYACLPTLLGYIGIGIAAGVIGKAAQLSVFEVTLMAIIVYAGASQFIIAGLLLVHTPISAIIFTVFLVNSRHFLMSMATAPYFKHSSLFNNIGLGSLLTDETFAVSMNAARQGTAITVAWMHGLNLSAYIVWVWACFIGALMGEWLPDPYAFGLDYALVAMFIGLLYLQLNGEKRSKIKINLLVVLTVIGVLYFSMRFLSAELAIIIATLAGCVVGVGIGGAT